MAIRLIIAERDFLRWCRMAAWCGPLWLLSTTLLFVAAVLSRGPLTLMTPAAACMTMATAGTLLGWGQKRLPGLRWIATAAAGFMLLIYVGLWVVLNGTNSILEIIDGLVGALAAWVGIRVAVTVAVLGRVPGAAGSAETTR